MNFVAQQVRRFRRAEPGIRIFRERVLPGCLGKPDAVRTAADLGADDLRAGTTASDGYRWSPKLSETAGFGLPAPAHSARETMIPGSFSIKWPTRKNWKCHRRTSRRMDGRSLRASDRIPGVSRTARSFAMGMCSRRYRLRRRFPALSGLPCSRP